MNRTVFFFNLKGGSSIKILEKKDSDHSTSHVLVLTHFIGSDCSTRPVLVLIYLTGSELTESHVYSSL